MQAKLRYDESALLAKLTGLSPRQRTLFAAACAERLVPLYRWSIRQAPAIRADSLERGLETLWHTATATTWTADLEDVRNLAMNSVPDDDSLGTASLASRYAGYMPTALAYAVACHQSEDPQQAVWAARQPYDAIDLWVATPSEIDFNEPGVEGRVASAPLIQAELSRQSRDLYDLEAAGGRHDAMVAQSLRDRALLEGSRLFGFPM